MRAAANQVCWVRIEDIVDERADVPWPDDGAVTVLKRSDGRYSLLSGGDQLSRMRAMGQSCVDAVVDPPDLLARRVSELLDRVVRGKLHYLDEAAEYQAMLDAGLSAQELATRLGRSVSTIRKKLRLCALSAETQRVLRSGLSERHAQELLRMPGAQGRLRIAKHALEEGLSVKETETLIDEVLRRMPIPVTNGRRLRPAMRDHRLYLNAIRGIVEQMQDAGFQADMQVTIGKSVAEVRVSVPLVSGKGR